MPVIIQFENCYHPSAFQNIAIILPFVLYGREMRSLTFRVAHTLQME